MHLVMNPIYSFQKLKFLMTFVSDCLIIDTILCDTKQTCLHPLFIVLMIVTFWRHSPADPLTNNVLLLLRLTTVMMKVQSTSFVNGTAGWGRWQVIEPDVSARRLPWAPEIDNSVSWRWSRELPLLHPRSRSPCSMHEQMYPVFEDFSLGKPVARFERRGKKKSQRVRNICGCHLCQVLVPVSIGHFCSPTGPRDVRNSSEVQDSQWDNCIQGKY